MKTNTVAIARALEEAADNKAITQKDILALADILERAAAGVETHRRAELLNALSATIQYFAPAAE